MKSVVGFVEFEGCIQVNYNGKAAFEIELGKDDFSIKDLRPGDGEKFHDFKSLSVALLWALDELGVGK